MKELKRILDSDVRHHRTINVVGTCNSGDADSDRQDCVLALPHSVLYQDEKALIQARVLHPCHCQDGENS